MAKKVLVVDDLEMMRQAIRQTLEGSEVRIVAEAVNGREAVRQYSAHRPDLVILDITMPVMDGLEALRRIKLMDKNAKVIMCSAMSGQKYVLRAIQLGANDFIVKPFKKERVISAVRKIVADNE